MNKIITTILIFLFTLQTLYPASFSILTPHENPYTAKQEIDPLSLISYYLIVFNSLLKGGHLNVTKLLSLSKYIKVPPTISYILNRLNELISKVNTKINQTKHLIEQSKLLIKFGIYNQACIILNNAKYHLLLANATLNDIKVAINELRNRLLKYLPGWELAIFNEKCRSLGDTISKLYKLIEELSNELDKLLFKAEEKINMQSNWLFDTHISIYGNESSVWVGKTILIYGRLYYPKGPLPNRIINIVSKVGNLTVITDENGFYKAKLKVDSYYKPSLLINVFYTPRGNDTKHYKAAYNKTVINVLYIKTNITVSYPRVIYLGLPVEIRIYIYPWVVNSSRQLSILINKLKVYEQLINANTITITVPNKYLPSVGTYVLEVYLSPYKEYSGSEFISLLTVTYKSIIIHLKTLKTLYLYPFDKIILFGKCVDIDSKPLSNEKVNIRYENINITTHTNLYGEFNVTINTAPLFIFKNLHVVATILPSELWYTVTSNVATISIINIPILIFIIASLLLTSFITRKYFAKVIAKRKYPKAKAIVRREKVKIEKTIEKHVVKVSKEAERRAEVKYKKVTPIYYNVVNELSKIISPPMKNETIREYYRRIINSIPKIKDYFWKLSLYTEYELYSKIRITEEIIGEAIKLHDYILNILRRYKSYD